MRLTRRTAIAALALALVPLATPGPAWAATTGDTTLTVELAGGLLSIAPPATATASGSVSAGSTITMSLADTTVTDDRGSLLGWTVTGSATSLTTGAGGANRTIPNAGMLWQTGAVRVVSGSGDGVSAGAPADMGVPWVAAAAVLNSGAGTYAYPATVTITVPPGLYAGSYTGTVTQSVA